LYHDDEISLVTERHRNNYNFKTNLKGRSVDHGLDSADTGQSTVGGSSEHGIKLL
jgi:hypothetical protein